MSATLIPAKYACAHCDKKYTKISDAKKHVIMCELLTKTPRERQIEEETSTDLPTHKQLCYIVMELLQKNIALETKLNQMSKWAERQRKKVSIIDWLNEHNTPEFSFAQFKERLGQSISQHHVEHLIKNPFIDTIAKIFEESNCAPLFCISHKQNVFYMYTQVLTGEELVTKWVIMTKMDIVDLLNYIHSKFLRELIKWNRNNADIISKNEHVSKQYTKMMIKFSEIEFSHDSTLCKIKTALHDHLKKDMKNMIEYEFV
jgi:hypothetical protein